jgi:hypothetical protein
VGEGCWSTVNLHHARVSDSAARLTMPCLGLRGDIRPAQAGLANCFSGAAASERNNINLQITRSLLQDIVFFVRLFVGVRECHFVSWQQQQ